VSGDLQRLDNGKIKCQLTDGKENISSVFTSQVAKAFGAQLQSNALVSIQEANVTAVGDSHVLIVAKAELLEGGSRRRAAGRADAVVAGLVRDTRRKQQKPPGAAFENSCCPAPLFPAACRRTPFTPHRNGTEPAQERGGMGGQGSGAPGEGAGGDAGEGQTPGGAAAGGRADLVSPPSELPTFM
jgi:hypothetical protein